MTTPNCQSCYDTSTLPASSSDFFSLSLPLFSIQMQGGMKLLAVLAAVALVSAVTPAPPSTPAAPCPECGDKPICYNTCPLANDGLCQDGGPGSNDTRFTNLDHAVFPCEYGTDCADCGPRGTETEHEKERKKDGKNTKQGNKPCFCLLLFLFPFFLIIFFHPLKTRSTTRI
jgi:hypothetical protein